MKKRNGKVFKITISIFFILVFTLVVDVVLIFSLTTNKYYLNNILFKIATYMSYFVIPLLLTPLLLKKHMKKMYVIVGVYILLMSLLFGISIVNIKNEERLEIRTDVNINVEEYLPFDVNSKIVKLGHKASLNLTDNLPVVDGAAAVFPVYSAFVNAVYPDTVKLNTAPFLYTNTSNGYIALANKAEDIFFGAYPSREQIMYAESVGTKFEYTKIGSEAFVFFVNKDNPVDELTEEQIKGIYSGKITNWKEVGGKDEKIIAFQRNEGSGSQSMLKRFMGTEDLMEAPKEEVNEFMSGIIEQVANYKNYSGAIGFSFRYYLEGIIQNDNVKMIKVNGVKPDKENIANGKYKITTPLYAVTYEGNNNPNVKELIDWVLSEEGQEIIEKTGYVGIGETRRVG